MAAITIEVTVPDNVIKALIDMYSDTGIPLTDEWVRTYFTGIAQRAANIKFEEYMSVDATGA